MKSNKDFDELFNKVGEIIDIPEPELLWSNSKDNENKFYGYKSIKNFEQGDDKKRCYGIWFMPKNKESRCGDLEKVKEDAILDIKRHLLWGDDVSKDDFPRIPMTEDQFNEIRKLGEQYVK